MDSRSRLDYALFQLTPTRTRCDLVICAGDCKEKLASGLLEPFIAHLKFAKDQILKGGYSITLSAPALASWFTKSTLERFVRFVSTPEVLERFITIEREITNIDSSINTNASSDTQSIHGLDEYSNKSAAFAYKTEGNTNDAVHEDDSKAHLQRVLETRKAVLQREQAMVYARALVAGFETDNLEDLICFADAFESPRLRDACLNFMQLCNMKSNDRVWMDAVAAMQAYPHSQYSYVEDDPVQELRINVQHGNLAAEKQNGSVDVHRSISHGTHLPQYMHSYQGGPMFHPSYQGYPFPGIVVHPYYQGNLPWPPNAEDSRSSQIRSHKKRSQELTQDGNFDSSDSSSESDSGSSKRSSLQKVVIKNINYISSVSDGKAECESEDNLSVGAVNQDLDRTVKDTHESQKVTQQWNIFQNLLLNDVDDKESEKSVSHSFEDPIIIPSGNQSEFATKTSTIGKHEGDWFLGSLQDKAIQEKSRDIFEDHMGSKNNVNDPLVVEAQSLNKSSDSQLKTQDILMISESNLIQKQVEATSVFEPKDLYIVLERDTADPQVLPAWTPEMESGNNNNNFANNKIIKLETPEVDKSKTKASVGKGLERKGSTIEAKSKALSGSRSKKSTETTRSTTKLKGKSQKEEEKRKKMEELLTQRQKRIAERSASTTKTVKNDKRRAQPASRDVKSSQKAVIRSSTIDRLSAARVINPKVLPAESKSINKPMKPANKKNGEPKPLSKPRVTTKGNGVSHTLLSRDMKSSNKTSIRSSTMDRLSATRIVDRKGLPTESKAGNKPMKPAKKSNGETKPVSKPTRLTTKENGVSHTLLSQRKVGADKKKVNPDKVKPLDKDVNNSKNLNGLKKKTADNNNATQLPKESHIKKLGNGVSIALSTPAQSDKKNGTSDALHKESSVVQKDIALSDCNDGSAAKKTLNSVSFIINEDNGARQNSIAKMNVEIPVREFSTPSPGKSSLERSNFRKKWSNLESSSKALSGFRKLLSFGRRS